MSLDCDTPESTAGDVEIEEVVVVLGLLGSRSIVSIDSLIVQNPYSEQVWAPKYYSQLPNSQCFAPLDSTNRNKDVW